MKAINIPVTVVEATLPQTQCGECGYAGCTPYAEAMLAGAETINKCPPGGLNTLNALAEIFNIDPTPFVAEVSANTRTASLAVIREADCIGCTKCISACPVDAIIGSGKLMHTIVSQECTGCELCVEPCPVDCIDLIELPQAQFVRNKAQARFNARNKRLNSQKAQAQQKHKQAETIATTAKQDYIKAALARVQQKTNGGS